MRFPSHVELYWRIALHEDLPQPNDFHEASMPILCRQSPLAMGKKTKLRPCLGYVVFRACKEHWETQHPEDPFPL
ncbi:hypothetical protein HYQ45_015469 [Verticillium longisporum]|uniref:Uncharacterized protein n=1 Tax=Verticillium longisporum TaxID=100787 RepID=A0A8I2Z6E0_VERLO|nr:hypothetical protein HYQ45_015469 [Verticillium longisporum]